MTGLAARFVFVAAMGVLAVGLTACNILGPAAYFAFGQAKVEPVYVLVDRPTVVFVDDRTSAIPLNASSVRRMIADHVSTELMKQEVLTETISSRDAMALARDRDREGALLSIEQIGEAVGAEQVIYIEMISFRGSPDGATPRPTASCRLKILDVANRTRIFPAPDANHGWQDVMVTSPAISPELYQSRAGRRDIQRLLSLLLADRIAKLFYPHIPDEIGSRLDPR